MNVLIQFIFSHECFNSIYCNCSAFYSLRSMVQDVVSKNTHDHVWGVLTTPGFIEVLGADNIYKSEANLAHSAGPAFSKAVS